MFLKSLQAEFEVFWAAYPRKVGKLAAMKAYDKARHLADSATILVGVEVYKRTKPTYADWCHPTTWLNQGRWMDELPCPPQQPVAWECPHQPRCWKSTFECHRDWMLEQARKAKAAAS